MLIRCITALAVIIFMCNSAVSFNLLNIRNVIEDMDKKAVVDYMDRKIISYYYLHSGSLPASTGDRISAAFLRNCRIDIIGSGVTENVVYQNQATRYRLGVLLSNGNWYFGRNSYDVTHTDLAAIVKERI